MSIYTKNKDEIRRQDIIKIKILRYQKALVLKKGMVDIMRKFDRTNMKYNNPAGDLLTELEAADLTSNKVDSLASQVWFAQFLLNAEVFLHLLVAN